MRFHSGMWFDKNKRIESLGQKIALKIWGPTHIIHTYLHDFKMDMIFDLHA